VTAASLLSSPSAAPVDDVLRRSTEGRFSVRGSGCAHLRLTRPLSLVVDAARAVAGQ
jgi:hypothetical protein